MHKKTFHRILRVTSGMPDVRNGIKILRLLKARQETDIEAELHVH